MTFGLVLGGGGVVGIAWEIGVLEALLQVLPGEAFAELRMQLMNPAFRAQGLEVGRRDGKAAAAGVRNLLGG